MRDVKHIVEDGRLGNVAAIGTGVQLKIGASPVTPAGDIILTGSSSLTEIREKLGYSPLADAVMDAVENGAGKIYCIPLVPEEAGTVGERTGKSSPGAAQVTATGNPHNAFDIYVEIRGAGGLNTAVFRYSLNGGYTWSEELTAPLAGTYDIAEAGIKLTFDVSEDKQYVIGDTFCWQTTAPALRTNQILAAVEALQNKRTEVEYVHVVGECNAEVWSSISALQKRLADNRHKPLWFILEAYKPLPEENIDTYRDRLLADRRKVSNPAIQVVAARLRYKGMDNLYRDANAAGILSGLYAKVAVNKSIGETATIHLEEGRVACLLPEGIHAGYISELDEAGYATLRQYDGLAGYYVTNARVLCPSGSDYRYAEDVRVLYKLIRLSRQAALLQLQQDIDMSNPERELAAKAMLIQAAVEGMVDGKEISSVSVTVKEGQDLLTTEELTLVMRYVPRGKIRSITVMVGVTNPYAE